MGGSATLLLALSLIFAFTTSSTAATFNCSSTDKCRALVDYVSPSDTNLSAIKTLFGVKNLRNILGANSFPLSTLSNFSVSANRTIKIPFRCACANGTGRPNKPPVYTVQKGDGLDFIATKVFSGLVKYQEIAAANNIPDPNNIDVGQELRIPLPCNCDEVAGLAVVHYGHVVAAGSSVEQIAAEYGTNQQTLLTLNGITDPKDLKAGAVIDVPLKACTSMVRSDSVDYPLDVSNGTYVFTANNCVMCKCDAAIHWTLQCEPSQLKPSDNSSWSTCPATQCPGTGNLLLGNTTTSGCDGTTCAYAGYNNQTILTALSNVSTCPTPASYAATIFLQCSSWNFIFICIHLVLLCLVVQ